MKGKFGKGYVQFMNFLGSTVPRVDMEFCIYTYTGIVLFLTQGLDWTGTWLEGIAIELQFDNEINQAASRK